MLRINNFSFSFGGRPVLKQLSLELKEGDYLSVLGPNGAGKSTLLKCLLRLHDRGVATGNIHLQGRLLAEYSQKELARIISYVPQVGGWTPPYTIVEFLRLSRYPHIKATPHFSVKDDVAVDRALHLTSLAALAGRRLTTLSGGERQKAFLAAALAQETPLMLLDEPASFLDPKHAAELDRLLHDLNKNEGLTMITVTHNLNHPAKVGGLTLVLKEGEALFFGPITGLFEAGILEAAYQHKFLYLPHPYHDWPVVLAE